MSACKVKALDENDRARRGELDLSNPFADATRIEPRNDDDSIDGPAGDLGAAWTADGADGGRVIMPELASETRDPIIGAAADVFRGAPQALSAEWFASADAALIPAKVAAKEHDRVTTIAALMQRSTTALDGGAAQPSQALAAVTAAELYLSDVATLAGFARETMTAGARTRALLEAGPIVRIETGIDAIDIPTRGGLWAGRLISVFGGAPDAGKTGLVTQIGHKAARAGYAVAIHAGDEDAEGIIRRIGQLEGFDRKLLEDRDPETLAALAKHLETELPNLLIIDQDMDEMMVTDTAAALFATRERLGALGAVLVCDSIQTARVQGTEAAKDPRGRSALVVAALKSIGSRGALVIATSEISRAHYSDPEKKPNPMAAFKESGGIEYAARHAFVLTKVDGGTVEVMFPKNKGGNLAGEDATFRLAFEAATCRFVDTAMPLPEEKSANAPAWLEWNARRVAYVVRKATGGFGGGKTAMATVLRAKPERVRAAVDAAIGAGWVTEEGKGKGARLLPGAMPPPAANPCRAPGCEDGEKPFDKAGGVCFSCSGSGMAKPPK